MSVLSWLKNLQIFSQGVTSSPSGSFQIINNLFGKAKEVSDGSLVERYRSWAYICATRNASRVASVPLRLYAARGTGEARSRAKARTLSRKEHLKLLNDRPWLSENPRIKEAAEIEEILVHPFNQLMMNINPIRDRFETFEETQIFLDITGNSYWLLEMNGLGIPSSIYLLPSQFVKIVPDREKYIRGYLYGRAKDKQALSPEEVIHFRNPNPRDPWYGMGCLEAALQESDLYSSMNLYEEALNSNMGVPPILIKYDGQIQNGEMQRIEAEWNKALRGLSKSGKAKVVDGKMSVEKLSFGPRELNFLQGRKWTRDTIAAAFGVPISLLTIEDVNRANSEQGLPQYEAISIRPRLKRIENKINQRILPFYNEPRLFAAFDDNVPEDMEFKLKEVTELFKGGVIGRDEAREMYGLPPAEGDDFFIEPAGPTKLGLNPKQQHIIDVKKNGKLPLLIEN